MTTQLEAFLTIDGDNVAAEVHSFVITPRRNLVTEEPTYGDASLSEKAGSTSFTVTIEAKNGLAADSLKRTLWTAFLTDSAEIPFVYRESDAAIGADNPQWSGNLVVSELTIGTKSGERRIMSQTFPANSVTMATSA